MLEYNAPKPTHLIVGVSTSLNYYKNEKGGSHLSLAFIVHVCIEKTDR